jgi:hypothetical protein
MPDRRSVNKAERELLVVGGDMMTAGAALFADTNIVRKGLDPPDATTPRG